MQKIRLGRTEDANRAAVSEDRRFILDRTQGLDAEEKNHAGEPSFTSINPSSRSLFRRPNKSRAQRSGSTSYSPVMVLWISATARGSCIRFQMRAPTGSSP